MTATWDTILTEYEDLIDDVARALQLDDWTVLENLDSALPSAGWGFPDAAPTDTQARELARLLTDARELGDEIRARQGEIRDELSTSERSQRAATTYLRGRA